jgi:putative SOS response-associated peptidase YedK
MRIEHELHATFAPVEPRFNIAPSQQVPVIRAHDGGYVMESMKWGLVPSWSKEPGAAFALFNARVETVAEKPVFRHAFRKQRCLIPASGFYEWKNEDGKKLPYYFSLADGKEMALAGLWETWRGNDGDVLRSCTVIVGPANPLVGGVHDRTACIVPPEAYADWLNPSENADYLLAMLQNPYDADLIRCWAVATTVNSVQNDGPGLIEPAD